MRHHRHTAAAAGSLVLLALGACAPPRQVLTITPPQSSIAGGASQTLTFIPIGVNGNPLFATITITNPGVCGTVAPPAVTSSAFVPQPTAAFTAKPNTGTTSCVETVTGTTGTTTSFTGTATINVLPPPLTATPLSANTSVVTLQPDIAPPVWSYAFASNASKIERIVVALNKPCPAPTVTTPPTPAIAATLSPLAGPSANWVIRFAPDTVSATIAFTCPSEGIDKADFEAWLIDISNKTPFRGVPGPR